MWLPLTHPLLGNWPTAQACALPGNGTGEPLVCRPALSPLSHTSQGCTGIMNEVERAKSESGRGKGLWQQVLPEWLPTWCQILRCDLCHTHTHTHTHYPHSNREQRAGPRLPCTGPSWLLLRPWAYSFTFPWLGTIFIDWGQ